MRFVISIGLVLSVAMLVCGDFIGSSDHRGGGNFGSNTNYHQHGFPSVGSSDYRRPNDYNNQGYPSVPLADNHRPSSNIYTQGFPSVNDFRGNTNDFRGNPNDYRGNTNDYRGNPNDYRGNSNDRRPNSDIYTHGFPSVNDIRGNPNTGYPHQEPYGNSNYPRGPTSDRPFNSRDGGGFGGSSYNRPSDYNPIGTRGSFGDPNMQTGYPQYNAPQSRPVAGYPNFDSISVGPSCFRLFNANQPTYGKVCVMYPNANGTSSSVLDVAKFEGNKMTIGNNKTQKKLIENCFIWHR